MQSSVGAAGGAGGLARVPPERAATNRGWLVHGARAGVAVGYVVRRIGRERRGRRASPHYGVLLALLLNIFHGGTYSWHVGQLALGTAHGVANVPDQFILRC